MGYATYNLNTGTNKGKLNYCTDGITIKLKGEDDSVKYMFRLLRAQPTEINYGTVSSEGNDLLKVTCTLVYDNFEVTDGNNVILSGQSNSL